MIHTKRNPPTILKELCNSQHIGGIGISSKAVHEKDGSLKRRFSVWAIFTKRQFVATGDFYVVNVCASQMFRTRKIVS
jgi:hypothetical protein